MKLRTMLPASIAAAVFASFTLTNNLAAQTAPTITYVASGTFASTPISGQDELELAGEPFTVSIAVKASTAPYQHGTNWAAYDKLVLKGVVHAGITGSGPEDIASNEATIIQAIDPGVNDVFTMEAPIKVVSFIVTIKAVIALPLNTLQKPLLYPFGQVQLTPANSTVSVSYNGASTVLAVQTGTLSSSVPQGTTVAKSAVALHANGAESVIHHADGTETVRSLKGDAIDLGMQSDTTRVKFYANGVSSASDVHVAIGGEEVPVLHAGESGYYRGLDEVVVALPRSLMGRGATEVSLTADGQTATPVPIRIQ